MSTSVVDYNSLTNAVANWMMRSGNADFLSNAPDFIAFFENTLNFGSDDPQFPSPPFRVSQMEIPQTTVTILSSTNSVFLPSDFLQLRRIYTSGSPIQKLTYVTPNQMDSTLANYPAGPPEEFYTIMGGQLVLASGVSTAMTIVFGYYQKIPALSSSNTVNWLLTAHPGLYLAGAITQGALFLGDDGEAQKWARISTAHIRAFRKQDLNARYSGDALQMKTDVGNP